MVSRQRTGDDFRAAEKSRCDFIFWVCRELASTALYYLLSIPLYFSPLLSTAHIVGLHNPAWFLYHQILYPIP